MSETELPNEIKIEPNYEGIRARFAAEARLQAATIIDGLLSETLVPCDYIRKAEADVLRAFQSVLVPINICIQAIDSDRAVLECRELVDAVTKTIIAKADEIEHADASNEGACCNCGRRGVDRAVVLYEMPDGKTRQCQACIDLTGGR